MTDQEQMSLGKVSGPAKRGIELSVDKINVILQELGFEPVARKHLYLYAIRKWFNENGVSLSEAFQKARLEKGKNQEKLEAAKKAVELFLEDLHQTLEKAEGERKE